MDTGGHTLQNSIDALSYVRPVSDCAKQQPILVRNIISHLIAFDTARHNSTSQPFIAYKGNRDCPPLPRTQISCANRFSRQTDGPPLRLPPVVAHRSMSTHGAAWRTAVSAAALDLSESLTYHSSLLERGGFSAFS